jgi:ferredoxin
MKVIKIDKAQWTRGIEKLRDAFRLYGPLKQNDNSYDFNELAPGQEPAMTHGNTRLSPKSLVFPQSEGMLAYTLDENNPDHHILKEVAKDYAQRAVLGIRPCDAKALTLVKMNFDTAEYKDPYWLKLYEATTFVGLGCDAPCQTCFCTTAGCGPFHEEGLDVLLADQGDHYLAKVLTEKGSRLMASAGWSAGTDDAGALDAQKKTAEEKISSRISTENLRGGDILALHGADFWEDVSFACINCGTCTFSCPTCWCFDIQDEVHGKSGLRMRNWDSCMFPIFTVHTTGHNPRGTKLQRVRQRFMHKLKYFVDKYDSGIMCVGCGRCIRQCPVNIDIRKVCELMNNLAAENACAVQRS